MNKKGELTSAQIIMLVIAIVGFGIVLIALFLIDFGGHTQEDICKLSVLTRATSPGATQSAIPLKCATKKICITDKFFSDKCAEQFSGEEDIEVVRLSGNINEKRRKIEEISANAMYDCWSMMGEGKLDLFGSLKADFGLGQVASKCVVCSRVAIDKSVGNDILYVDGVSAIKINDYMRTHQIPGSSLTYLQEFTDRGVSSFSAVDEQVIKDIENIGVEVEPQTKNEMAFVFMQVKSDKVSDVLTNLGLLGATAVGTTFLSPAGGFVGKIIGVVGAKVVVIGTLVAGIGAGGIATYNALEGQKVAAMHCGEFISDEETKNEGCSIVQGTSYDFRTINSICGSIEGEL